MQSIGLTDIGLRKMTDLNDTQERAIRHVTYRILSMRPSGHGDSIIRASLISEGWPLAAVNIAFERVKLTP